MLETKRLNFCSTALTTISFCSLIIFRFPVLTYVIVYEILDYAVLDRYLYTLFLERSFVLVFHNVDYEYQDSDKHGKEENYEVLIHLLLMK